MIRLLLLLYDPLSYSTLARRETGENDEQSVFSESGWSAYTYIEVVLRVADIHTWRAT